MNKIKICVPEIKYDKSVNNDTKQVEEKIMIKSGCKAVWFGLENKESIKDIVKKINIALQKTKKGIICDEDGKIL